MNFPKANRKKGGRISMGKFTPEREQMIAWQTWLLDNNVPRQIQNEIAEKYPDMTERLEYIKTLDEPTFSEKVDRYVKAMTSETAKYELPDGDRVERCPHGKEIRKGRPVRCTECYSMDC